MVTSKLPQTPTSERRVLARLIMVGKREQGASYLTQEDFTTIYRKKLFEAYSNISRRLPEFDEKNVLNEAKLLLKGNESDQHQLELSFEEVCNGGGAPDLDEEIVHLKNYTKKRKLIEFSEEAINASKEIAPDITSLVDKLANLQAGGVKVKSFDKVIDDVLTQLRARWQNGNKLMGITTTLGGLDYATGGIMGGEVAIIAGRPGSGKTSLMIQQVAANLKADKKVAYFSLEMQEVEVMEKLLSHELNINSRFVSAPPGDETRSQVESKALEIKTWPLKLFDNIFGINEIINTCWFLKETTGLDAIYIDYLQLIDTNKKMFQSDNSSVAYVSRMLKVLASQLNVPVIVGCQLNRKADMRDEQMPRLSDMRDSGAIEQDASIVMAMHYHELTEKQTKTKNTTNNETGFTKSVDIEVDHPTGQWKTTAVLLLKNRRGRANFGVGVDFIPDTSTFRLTMEEVAVNIFGAEDGRPKTN